MEITIILQFLESIFLQEDGGAFGFLGDRGALGSDDPMIKGLILSMFTVAVFGILLNLFNSGIRRKLVDQVKLKRIMKETRAFQKERMAAFRAKDTEKQAELNRLSKIPKPDTANIERISPLIIGSSLPRAPLSPIKPKNPPSSCRNIDSKN